MSLQSIINCKVVHKDNKSLALEFYKLRSRQIKGSIGRDTATRYGIDVAKHKVDLKTFYNTYGDLEGVELYGPVRIRLEMILGRESEKSSQTT
jgi:hypothetical protein